MLTYSVFTLNKGLMILEEGMMVRAIVVEKGVKVKVPYIALS